ncbi:MAG: hypothetical protein HPY45_08895 [Anaerolineae bacterium]|nr:hypothetical protein [Anaerolineae bacterium]
MEEKPEDSIVLKSREPTRIWIIILLAIGAGMVILFGLRSLHSYRRIHEAGVRPFALHPDRRSPHVATDVEELRPWMTVPQVAKMYAVPEDYLFQVLNISPAENRHKSLQIINREIKPGVKGYVIEKLKQAILQFQREHSLPEHAPAITP